MNKFHRFASTKCKIETDDFAMKYAKSDEHFDEMCRPRNYSCGRNGPCASVKRTDYSYQLLNDQSNSSKILPENTPYVYCPNTQAEEFTLQHHPESSNYFDNDNQYDTLHTTEDNSSYRGKHAVFDHESVDMTNKTTTVSSFPCHYSQIMTTNIVNNSNQSLTNVPEPMSGPDYNHSHFPNLNHTAQNGTSGQGTKMLYI